MNPAEATRLAQAESVREEGRPQAAVDRLVGLLDDPQATLEGRGYAHWYLGKCFDDLSQPGRCVDQYALALSTLESAGYQRGNTPLLHIEQALDAYQRAPTFFISYSSRNSASRALRDACLALARRRGIKLEVDVLSFGTAPTILNDILQHLDRCTVAIILISTEYLDPTNRWCQAELQRAAHLHAAAASPIKRVRPVLMPGVGHSENPFPNVAAVRVPWRPPLPRFFMATAEEVLGTMGSSQPPCAC